MALSAGTLAGLIQSNLESFGANGSNLSKFCNAVASGIVMSIVGKAFVTADAGSVSGSGTGVGVGILGLSASTMESTALSLMSSRGVNASPLMQSIMQAVVSHLSSSASLVSVDSPVFIGTGTIVVGSIAVSASEMSNNIDSQLEAQGAVGSNRTELATDIGTAIVENILSSGTGTLTITGSGGSPSPGSGSGTGTIS